MRDRVAWRWSAGVIASAVVATSPHASAQSVIPSIEPGTRVQTIGLASQIIYDSNVAGTSSSLAALRGIAPSDEIVSPSLSFELARPIGRETVYLQGSAGYEFHLRNKLLNRENIDVRPGVIGQIAGCQVGLGGGYSRAQSDQSQLAFTPNGIITPAQQQNVLEVEQLGGTASCGKATGFAPNLSVSETLTNNSSPIQRFTNARTFSASGGLAYRRPTFGALSVFGSYSRTDYPDRAGLINFGAGSIGNGFQTSSVGVIYTRSLGSRLRGTVSVSYTKLENLGTALPGFGGLTYSANVTYQLSSRIQFAGNVSRATAPSNRLNSSYSIQEAISGQVLYQLGRRITLSGGGSSGHNIYDGVPYPIGFDLTDEKTYTVFGDAAFRLTQRLSFDLNVQHLQRNANFPGLNYPDTRVGLTARATF